MKKMLTMLFLLFALSTFTSLNSGNYNDGAVLAQQKRIEIYSDLLVGNIEEEVEVAYHNWDYIPVLSPISIREIKNISSDYGYRNHPILKLWTMHDGIDLSAKVGTNVYSTANGTVIKVKRSHRGYGNEVVIQHNKYYSTRYAHLESICVNEGDIILSGTSLGTVGTTGMSTGPHLHYEILKDGLPIDPMSFTYKDKTERSIGKYFSTLIALEQYNAWYVSQGALGMDRSS